MTESYNPEDIYWEALNAWSHYWFTNFRKLCKECDIILEAEEGWYIDQGIIFKLCRSPNFTFELMKSYPNIKWNISFISANPNVTTKIINENPNYEWDYSCMSCNVNVTEKFVSENIDKNWDYNHLQQILPEKFFIGLNCEIDEGYLIKNIRNHTKGKRALEFKMIKKEDITGEHGIIHLLTSPFLSWDIIFEMKITKENIDYIIRNEMELERHAFILKFFQKKFSESALKRELLG